MLGENVKMSRNEFNPYLPDHKDGYYELDQIKPGVVLCPFCDAIIDATQHKQVLAAFEVVKVWPDSWASVPVCRCPGVWAIYSPKDKKWAFRYQDGGKKLCQM
jgi:hypothetical protein